MRHFMMAVFALCLALLLCACAPEDSGNTTATDAPHVHSYAATRVFHVTCTEDGYTLMSCSCGVSYEADYVKAPGHDYQLSHIVEPTDTEDGYTLYTCHCGDSYKADETSPTVPAPVWSPPKRYPITADNLPIIEDFTPHQFNMESNGFFAFDGGNWFLSVHGGRIRWLQGKRETVTLTLLDNVYHVEFSWCTYAGEIGVYMASEGSVTPIPGNDKYVQFSLKALGVDRAPYLLELETMALTNPFAKLSGMNFKGMWDFTFAPDLTSVLMYRNNPNRNTYFMDLETSIVKPVSEPSGLDPILSAGYIDSETLVLFRHTADLDAVWKEADCIRFDLATGQHTLLHNGGYGLLIGGGGMENFGSLVAHYENENNCIIDCITGIHYAVPKVQNWQLVSGCGNRSIWVYTTDRVFWLIKADGTATPVFAMN